MLCGALSSPDASLRCDHGAGAHRWRPPLPRRTASRRPTGERSSGKVRRSAAVHPGPAAPTGRERRPARSSARHGSTRAAPRPPRARAAAPSRPARGARRVRRFRLPAGRRLPHPPGRALRCGSPPSSPAHCWPCSEPDGRRRSPSAATPPTTAWAPPPTSASPAASTTPACAAASPRPRPRPAWVNWPPPAPPVTRRPCSRTQGRLTTCYCMRWGQMHYGLDLAAPLGTPIYSAVDGVVIKAGGPPASATRSTSRTPTATSTSTATCATTTSTPATSSTRATRSRGRQRGLLDRPPPALRDPPRRENGRPLDPQD